MTWWCRHACFAFSAIFTGLLEAGAEDGAGGGSAGLAASAVEDAPHPIECCAGQVSWQNDVKKAAAAMSYFALSVL